MKLLSVALVFILLVGCQKETTSAKPPTDQEIKKDEDQIKQKTAQVFKGNQSDLWSEHPILVNLSTHETMQGHAEIDEYLKHFNAKTAFEPEKVIIKDDTASEVGKIDNDTGYKAEYVKENGNWVLNKFYVVSFEKPPSQYEHLKELDWLVGKWVQQNEFAEVNYEGAFDDNKNFLTLTFNVNILGHDELKGHEVIAWDPNDKKLRSWIFDSDGGFGEGRIIKSDDSWLVNYLFTLPDGRLGSSTQVYKKIDDDTFTFESINRDVDGKLLPNIGPFKITREKEAL